MAIKTFEHVLILANDVEKTKDFYVDILGRGRLRPRPAASDQA